MTYFHKYKNSIIKEIDSVYGVFSENEVEDSYKGWRAITKILRKRGFKAIYQRSVLINKFFVVKLESGLNFSPPPRKKSKFRKYIVPTIRHKGIIIQPRCITDDDTSKKVLNWFDERGIYGWDFHEGNCGLYRGKRVIFDW